MMTRSIRWLVPTLVLTWAAPGHVQEPAKTKKSAAPANVRIETEIPYADTRDPRQTLDLYLPRSLKSDKPLPLVVNIHGGAFMAGDKSMGVGEVIGLVESGDYAAASINYRLSGQARWPAQIHDVKAAIRWLRANAAKYGLDPDRIGVIGASAGGHLAAMLGTAGDVAELEGSVGPHVGVSSKVRCVVDQFGPTELLTMSDYPSRINHDAADSPESRLVGGAIQEHKEAARAASPITYVTRNDPPFLIFHGTADPLVPFNQSERFAAAIKAAGVPCVFVPVTGAGHGGFRSPEVGKRIRQFFDRHLRDQSVGEISGAAIPQTPARSKTARAPAAPGQG